MAAEKEVVVANITALTGPVAAWGTRTDRGLRMILDKINSQGGIKSLGGAKIKYIVADTESKPEIAASQAEKMVANPEVSCILGTNQSASGLLVSQVAERNKVPMISHSDQDPLMTERGFKYLFRIITRMDVIPKYVLEFAQAMNKAHNSNFRKLGILCEDSIPGDTVAKTLEKYAKEIGYTVVDVVRYNAATTKDFSGVLSRYKAQGVELLSGHNKPADAIQIVRNCKEIDFNPALIGGITGGWSAFEFPSNLGSLTEGISVASMEPLDTNVGKYEEFRREYETKYNEGLELNAMLGAAGAWLLYDTLERCGSKDRQQIAKALQKTDIKYGQGYFFMQFGCKFDERGENIRAGATISQFQSGTRVNVFPVEFSTKKPFWPKPKFR